MFQSVQQALRVAYRQQAHAELVLPILEGIDVNGQAYLKARYGKQLLGGEQEREVADILMRVAMAALPTGQHSKRGVEKLVRIYFGQTISKVSTRCDLKCTDAKYLQYKAAVKEMLDQVAARAEGDAFRALEDAGLLVVEAAA